MKTLIDLHNILHPSFSIAKAQVEKEKGNFTEDDIGLYYHKLLDFVIGFAKTYGEVIYCDEGKGSTEWRKSIYPEYKGNRVRDESFELFKKYLPDVKELISYFPCKIMNVKGAEADDIIYSLSTYFADNGEDVLIVSSDKDLVQLMNYSDKIKVYSPFSKSYREKNPTIILEKAVVGDASDNIKGIPRIGPKTFQKALNDKSIWESKILPYKDLVNTLIEIIDLSKAPSYIKEEAIIQNNSTDFSTIQPQAIESFMFENNLKEHLENWNRDLADINNTLCETTKYEKSKKEVEVADEKSIEEMLTLLENTIGDIDGQ